MDDQERDKQYTDMVMTFIADTITNSIPKKHGFALLVFPFNAPGVVNYISNASHEDMIIALRKKADILEKGGDIMVEQDAPIQ